MAKFVIAGPDGDFVSVGLGQLKPQGEASIDSKGANSRLKGEYIRPEVG